MSCIGRVIDVCLNGAEYWRVSLSSIVCLYVCAALTIGYTGTNACFLIVTKLTDRLREFAAPVRNAADVVARRKFDGELGVKVLPSCGDDLRPAS